VLDITIGATDVAAKVVALPVRINGESERPVLARFGPALAEPLATEVGAYLAELDRAGSAGSVQALSRPGRDPGQVLLVGIGDGDEAGWRSAGAALARHALHRYPTVWMRLPVDDPAAAAWGLAEGAWLASYRFTLTAEPRDSAPKLRRLVLTLAKPAEPSGTQPAKPPVRAGRARSGKATVDSSFGTAALAGARSWRSPVTAGSMVEAAVAQARAVTDAVILARDLTNTPSLQKSPKWMADRLSDAAARRKGVAVTVLNEDDLANGGFGGILAIGAGSARPPRLVELSWRPRGARTHVVLVGKGITFDSGGISLKPLEGMRLMRKDMGGAAAVCATVLAAADLNLPIRVTALAPLAENMVSGSAIRPGDVIRHYGGLTSEVRNTDAEGRVVVGDALAYAVRRLRPDLLIDLATLTGAASVALGKRTASMFTQDDDLAKALQAAGDEVGERMWRLPLADEYQSMVDSDIADLTNLPSAPQAGTIVAALYLREFTGNLRDRWAHIDMSPTSWIETNEDFLVKGATGWGVRMLIRFLANR
jgi:leucyl aminopeptidase